MEDDASEPSFAAVCLHHPEYGALFHSATYKTAEVIHTFGAPIKDFGIVLDGSLKSSNYTLKGTEMCNCYFEKEDVFPELLYYSGIKEYDYTLSAVKRTTVAWIPAPVFNDMLNKNPDLMRLFLIYVSKRGLMNQTLLCCLRYQTIRERIAYWLTGMDNLAQGEGMTLPSTQTIWANMLRVSRSSLNQEINRMEQMGYFRIQNHQLQVLDRKGLEGMI